MSVLRLLASRILFSALTLLLVSVLIFLILEALPGDVATRILGRDATVKALELLRSQLDLDQPALVRYFQWLGDFLRGDLGVSIATGRPITDVLGPRIVNTLLLSLFAFTIYLVLALVPAIIQATNRGKAVDNIISVITLVLLSLPDFLLATILLFLFAVAVPILPALATISEASTWQETLRAMVLPAVTEAAEAAAKTCLTRGAFGHAATMSVDLSNMMDLEEIYRTTRSASPPEEAAYNAPLRQNQDKSKRSLI